jgi:hypothetical protein
MAADMNSSDGISSEVYLDRRLIGGSAVLISAGLLTATVGAMVGAVAVVRACRRYVADLPEPPGVTARKRWQQARSASAAGLGAWQEHGRRMHSETVS